MTSGMGPLNITADTILGNYHKFELSFVVHSLNKPSIVR